MFRSRRFPWVLLILVLVGPAWHTEAHPQFHTTPQQTEDVVITVSGTVTGPGGVPVAGARVEAWLPTGEGASATTNAGGFYELTIPPGDIAIHARPLLASRLAERYLHVGYRDTSFTQNFEVLAGHLVTGTVLLPSGDPPDREFWVAFDPVSFALPEREWLGTATVPGSGAFQVVVPVGTYWIGVTPPAPYYPTHEPLDLTSGDVTGVVLTLGDEPAPPIPYDSPDASKITIGAADDLGEAIVMGAAGAALPLAHVLVVNLNSTHQAHAISAGDGRFVARIYSPPGSAIMVKHGPHIDGRWGDLAVGVSEGLNPFPGTIINVPHTHTGDQHSLAFAAAGAIDYYTDDPGTTLNYVGSAWAITGTIGPVVVEGEWTRVLTGTYEGDVVPGLYLGGLNWTHPALGDLDGDGDLDLLVGERSGRLVLHRNTSSPLSASLGSAAPPDWRFETADYAGVATGGWAYPALADVTGDGALDLLVGAGDGTLSIYYNAGTSTTPLWPDAADVSLSVGSNASPAVDDLDGDSDLDLLVGHAGGTLYHFENTGTITNPIWTQQTSEYGSINESGGWLQPAFVELDGDADRDLLVGRCGELVWYRRGGSTTNPTWTRVAGDPTGYGGGSCATSPGAGDWDSDGDTDLVTGEHWGNLRFFRNDGLPTWKEQEFLFPFELLGDTAPALADWDDDGDLDMLLGQPHGDVYRYTNVGTATSPNWQPGGVLLSLPWTNHPHPFPTFADIDGDNDHDLFIGEGSWEGPGAGGNVRYYRNDGTSSSPNWTLVTDSYLGLDMGGWSTPVFVDIDSDNDLDLCIGDEEGTLTFLENTGSATSPNWASPTHPYAGLDLGSYSAPAFSDVDEDGDLDMLVGSENGSLAYVRNTGTVQDPSWELVSTQYPGIDIGDHSTPVAADINGDATSDLLIGDGDGGLNVYLYEGPGTPPATGDIYAPGDLFQGEGRVRLYGPAITATTDVDAISVDGGLALMLLHNREGQPMAAQNYFMSTMLAPSGFPIQRNERAVEWLGSHITVDNLHYLGGHAVGGNFTLAGQVPEDLPPGIYRPLLSLDVSGVPTSTDWVAANVVRHTFYAHEAALPPIRVGSVDPPRLNWRLLMDDFVQGTRGTGAREDHGTFELASQIVSQGAPCYVPPLDLYTGQPVTYRLEPFLPMISFTDRRMPTPPLIPFDLPGGQFTVVIHEPDGRVRDLGSEAFAQSFNRTKTTRAGHDLNIGTVQLDDVYSLKAASNRFHVTFDQYGHHVITMTGVVSDIWGNSYSGGGTYDMWIANPLDVDPGVLPGTPLAVGDAFNPAMQFYPRVPAEVALTVTLYPDSDPTRAITHTLTGQANLYGYFSSRDAPISMTQPGEYRVDLTAIYTNASGEIHMGAMTWGGVVMTPESEAHLVAHGRRGLDSLPYIPNHWFVAGRDLTIPEGAISHSFNPYRNGDILWSRMSDGPYGGDSLLLGASVHDTVGTTEAAIQARADRVNPPLASPGSLSERFDVGEIPLFISTRSGRPAQFFLSKIEGTAPDDVDQIAYSYRSSQRPGVRVRELVAEDGQTGGYWRLDTLYDDQLGVGVLGDQPNDFKFQYVGVVYRDLDTGHNEYLGEGSGWIFIPDDDPTGTRVMPPFAGPGNGGWITEGGPILTLKGEEVHIFILPTGTRSGAVLQVGDLFHFAGHIMPTLDSQVAVTVTAPSGTQHLGGGQANLVGYFYDPDDDFVVGEAGLWSVDVRVWHDGQCSGGATIPPYPSGDVLGSEEGRYWFYVVPESSPRLHVSSPSPGFLSFEGEVHPVTMVGSVPEGLTDVTVDYTISMPGYILDRGQVAPFDGIYTVVFDPVTLHNDFPNLDLIGRDDWNPGLADTFAIGLLLRGQSGSSTVYRANTITIQGDQVFVGDAPLHRPNGIYLPLILHYQPTER